MLVLPFGIGAARADQGAGSVSTDCTSGLGASVQDLRSVCPPKLKTKVSDDAITAGGSVTDLLTLNGVNHGDDTPGGTVTFFLCGPQQVATGCPSGGSQVGSPVSTVDGVGHSTATSPPASPTDPGIYCFRAEFQPGANEPFAPGSHTNAATECFSVTARQDIGIHVVKTGPKLTHVGDTITYTLHVNVTTQVPLGAITVTDPVCGSAPAYVSGDDGDGLLEPGETWTYTCDHVVTANDPDPLPNTATVQGTSQDDQTATDTDDHTVDVIHPKIHLVKTVDPASGDPGATVTYTYTVTNVGDTTLFAVSVDDDVLGHVGTIAKLEPGHTATLTKDYALPADEVGVKNTGTAKGHDVLGTSVADDDTAVVTIVAASSPTPSASGPPKTAFTGSDAGPLGALAAALAVLGMIGLAVGRRRSREA